MHAHLIQSEVQAKKKKMNLKILCNPALIILTKNIRIVDPDMDQIAAGDIAAAINTLTLDIGEFIGPIFGGFITSHYDFKTSCVILFFIGICFTFFFVLYFFSYIKNELFIQFF